MTEAVAESSGTGVLPKTPIHVWVVGVLALLWNGLGVFDYLATELRLEFYMSGFTDEQLDYFYGFPSWFVALWALAVWSGLAGAVGLLLRRNWAVWLFGLALIGLAASSFYNFVLSNGAEIMGTPAVFFTGVIWLFSVLLFVYAMRQSKRGVLR